jgi:predicted oxidoreductase
MIPGFHVQMTDMTEPKTSSSPLIYGCMMIGGTFDASPLDAEQRKRGRVSIETALECGLNFFDHADIYCHGKSETIFGEFLKENANLRDKLILQSKCGIYLRNQPQEGLPGRFDLSFDHILQAVDESLKRLQTSYLDILLLHRPDPLVEPKEVAQAFDRLHRTGKVRRFGVSNHSPAQIELLRAFVDQPIEVNQIEYNPIHTVLHDSAIHANMRRPEYGNPGEGIIEYCRLHGITLQAWGSLAKGVLTGKPQGPQTEPRIRETAALIERIANEKNVSREAIVIAWILRHPAGIMPVVGTTNPDRLRACCQGTKIELSRIEWYQIYSAAMGHGVP